MAAADDRLADRLGIPAQVVTSHRVERLIEGIHFTRADTGRIDYTPDGEAAVIKALNPEKMEAAPIPSLPPEKKEEAPAPIEPGKPVLLKILRRYPNPLFVDVLANGKRHAVRVRNNALVDPQKRLLCREWPDGRWECCQRGQAVALNPLASSQPEAGPA